MKEKTKFLVQYYLIYFFKNFLFLRIYLVLVLTKNLTATQVSLILSIYSITSILTEIPIGTLSDVIGCKELIIYSMLILIAGYLIILFNKSFYSFCIFYCCFGFYDTVFSVSKETIIYNNMKYLNIRKKFSKYKNIARIISFSSLSIATFISGKLVNDNLNLALKIDILSLILYLLIILWINERRCINLEKLNNNYLKSLKNGFKYVLKHKTLMKFVIFEGIWYSIMTIVINFCPVFYKEIYSIERVNIIVSLQIILLAVLQLCFINHLFDKFEIQRQVMLFIYGAICGILSFYLYDIKYSFILNVFYFFFTQMTDILIYIKIQDLIPSKSRTCISSIRSFSDSLFGLVFLYILGILSNKYNYRIGFLSLFIIYLFCCIVFVYSIYKDKHLKKK